MKKFSDGFNIPVMTRAVERADWEIQCACEEILTLEAKISRLANEASKIKVNTEPHRECLDIIINKPPKTANEKIKFFRKWFNPDYKKEVKLNET